MNKKLIFIIMVVIISMMGFVGCGSKAAPLEEFEGFEEVENVVRKNDFSLETAQRISDGFDLYNVLLPVNWSSYGRYDEIHITDDVDWDWNYYPDVSLRFYFESSQTGYSEELAKIARDESLDDDIANSRSAGEDITIGDITFYTLMDINSVYGDYQFVMYGCFSGTPLTVLINSNDPNKIEDSDIQSIIQSIELGSLNNRDNLSGEFELSEIVYRNYAESGLEIIGVPRENPDDEVVETPEEQEPEPVEYDYTNVRNLKIEGKWQVVSETGFGQAQPGAIIVFEENYCNFYSPRDTYALIKDGDTYSLSVTSLMGESKSYTVNTIDKNNIVIANTHLSRID